MKLKSGKEEIAYLLSKVVEKYEKEAEIILTKNSNRKNYESIAILLSKISNQLPNTSDKYQHEVYPIDQNLHNQEYPFRKYDITSNQIKDAYYHQIVSNPRAFLIDACYIYLYGVGRKGFELDPKDKNLLKADIVEENKKVSSFQNHSLIKQNKFLLFFSLFCLIGFSILIYQYLSISIKWETIKNDFKILPYQPTKAEIESLEGVWISYIGSPQARLSDANRYHMIAENLIDIRYKDGYFVFTRYGVNFNHEGYAQFESPWIVSLHSFVKNHEGKIESPRHTLMKLDHQSKFISVISASWNFDVAEKNSIIGIREVFIKQGRGGKIGEIINTIENSSCKCKIIRWEKENGKTQLFQLKNQLLETLPTKELQDLLNEKSILLRTPKDDLLLLDSIKK